ncbi:hypothetical protein CRG98_016485 [Punica granatum]|uniref:Uncharacterized protein n=1 Tax=Punica granatum TaxID=22663 RepID=A0A2I0K3J6_PUNGR|nr:hypothetical protein CRG98_016485 [Punica granatum]
MQKSKLARVTRPGKVARGMGEVAQRTCGAGKYARTGLLIRQGCKRHGGGGSANLRCRKVCAHWFADPARLQEAWGRWLSELAVQERKYARTGLLIRQGCKRHGGGGSANLRCRKVCAHWFADPARLQEARASRLGKLAFQENKRARVSRPGKVARGTSEVARRTCGAGKYARTGLLIRQGCKRQEGGGSANLRCKKVSSPGLADPAWLQEARARWLGERVGQEIKLARVSSHGLAYPARLQEARARWLGELKVLVSSHGLAYPARLQEARARWLGELKVLVSSHGLAYPARLQEARARWLGELKVLVSSHGLAYPARLQEARARWLGELKVLVGKFARVSIPGKVARGTSEVARRT